MMDRTAVRNASLANIKIFQLIPQIHLLYQA
jgi:hypothetical protein